ncbi:MAG: CDP-diacylglycerol--glycerol-3-phosphate 3-phosphatidyltransferase [Mollicutes bacterium]|nr:CDP-diacylglycerol--glycerol-3-phosphate 3-phosphatidyltransferase [Mollicutes bacterium]
MNIPNKITLSRIVLSIIILIILMVPASSFGFNWPIYDSIFKIKINPLSLKYIVSGILFVIASLTDKLDGYLAKKWDMVTDFGKMIDAIADKILVNGVLIILAYDKLIPVAIPVIIITRDIITDTCKMVSGNKGKVVSASSLGRIKTAFMMVGVSFVFFGNLPFQLIPFDFAGLCIIIATVLSVVSGCQYFFNTRKLLKQK